MRDEYQQFFIDTFHQIKQSGLYNFQGCRIQLPTKFNFQFIESELKDYNDPQVVEFLKFGFPVDCCLPSTDLGIPLNHKGATEFPAQIQQLLDKEVKLGDFIGPFKCSPFPNPRYSPLNYVPKKDSDERRLILDLSFPKGSAINDGINKDSYLGEFNKLTLPSLDQFVQHVVSLGRCCKMFKVDLS